MVVVFAVFVVAMVNLVDLEGRGSRSGSGACGCAYCMVATGLVDLVCVGSIVGSVAWSCLIPDLFGVSDAHGVLCVHSCTWWHSVRCYFRRPCIAQCGNA